MDEDTKTPKISVIIATYNRANLLPSSVESILNQTFDDFELIIIDDASEDNTREVLKELSNKDERIRIITNLKNLGNGPTRNIGLKIAQGEFIAMLGDDDVSLPNRLETQESYFRQHPDVDLIFSTYYKADQSLNILGIEPKNVISGEFPQVSDQIFKQLFLSRCDIIDSSCMFRRKILSDVDGYGTTSTATDRTFFLKVAARGYQIRAITQPLVIVRSSMNYVNHLQAKRKMVLENRIKVIHVIKDWLKVNNIHKFDNLHNQALSNALIRYARYVGGFHGLVLTIRALFIYPNNTLAQQTVRNYFSKLKKHI